MAERCDFYSDEEYQQYLAFEEERYKEEQAKKEYEEECAYQEYLNNNKFADHPTDKGGDQNAQ